MPAGRRKSSVRISATRDHRWRRSLRFVTDWWKGAIRNVAKVRVDVEHSGNNAVTPVAFTLLNRTFRVREVVDQWWGSDHTYCKLVADDGNIYVIRRDLEDDTWELVMMEAGGHT